MQKKLPTGTAGDAAEALVRLMERLRKECPWDRKQTFQTLSGYLLEECYEALDALQREDFDELEGELGDLLFEIVFLAELGSERGDFDLASVARRIHDKMVARHPHVFGEASVHDAEGVRVQWEELKKKEREKEGPPALPLRRRPARAARPPQGGAPHVARRGPRLRLGARRRRPREARRGGRRVQGRARVASGRRRGRPQGPRRRRDRRPPLHRRQRRPPPRRRPGGRAPGHERQVPCGGSRRSRDAPAPRGRTSRARRSRSWTGCGMRSKRRERKEKEKIS